MPVKSWTLLLWPESVQDCNVTTSGIEEQVLLLDASPSRVACTPVRLSTSGGTDDVLACQALVRVRSTLPVDAVHVSANAVLDIVQGSAAMVPPSADIASVLPADTSPDGASGLRHVEAVNVTSLLVPAVGEVTGLASTAFYVFLQWLPANASNATTRELTDADVSAASSIIVNAESVKSVSMSDGVTVGELSDW